MSFIITATGGTATDGGILDVKVLDGALPSGGATPVGNHATTTPASAITPVYSHSLVCWIGVNDSTDISFTAQGTTTLWDNTATLFSGTGATCGTGFYNGTTAAGTATPAVGCTNTTSQNDVWTVYEIPPSVAGVTPTVDTTSPTAASNGTSYVYGEAASGTAVHVTTNGQPPIGSVLMAMVSWDTTNTSSGLTMAITDTSGLGLVWTQIATQAYTTYASAVWAFTTTVVAREEKSTIVRQAVKRASLW